MWSFEGKRIAPLPPCSVANGKFQQAISETVKTEAIHRCASWPGNETVGPDYDPLSLSKIRADLPIYIFSGSEDPVGLQLEGVRILIERYQNAGVRGITTISILAAGMKCSMRLIVARSVNACLVGSLRCWVDKQIVASARHVMTQCTSILPIPRKW